MKKAGETKTIPTWLYAELEAWANGSDVPNIREHVATVIRHKTLNAQKHYVYSASKDTRRPADEREAARQVYLDLQGVPDSFRYGDINENH